MIYCNHGFAKLLDDSSDLLELFSQISLYWDYITDKSYKLVKYNYGKYYDYNSVVCDCIHDGNRAMGNILALINALKEGGITDSEIKKNRRLVFFNWMHYVTVLEMFLDLIERLENS